jgi:hypothetical protein
MQKVSEVLISRLQKKGLTPVETRRLIKDVVHIISKNKNLTATIINKALNQLGWDGYPVDVLTLDQILYLHEGGEITSFQGGKE